MVCYGRQQNMERIGLAGKIICPDRPFPVRMIEHSEKSSRTMRDRMVARFQQMLDLHARQPQARTDHERTALARQMERTDAEIDRLVYELYGLTAEEIALVEARTAK